MSLFFIFLAIIMSGSTIGILLGNIKKEIENKNNLLKEQNEILKRNYK